MRPLVTKEKCRWRCINYARFAAPMWVIAVRGVNVRRSELDLLAELTTMLDAEHGPIPEELLAEAGRHGRTSTSRCGTQPCCEVARAMSQCPRAG
jgi:hypothetical protein